MGKNKLKEQKVAKVINAHINLINKTAKYPVKIEDYSLGYLVSGIGDEYGEFIEKIDQFYDHYSEVEDITIYNKTFLKDCYKEAGDILWYINALITKVLNMPLDDKFYNKVINNLIFSKSVTDYDKTIYNYDFLNKLYDNIGFSSTNRRAS